MADASSPIEATPEQEAVAADTPPRRRRWLRLIIMLIVPAALIAGAVTYWLSLQGKVSTDNAYLQQDKVSVSAQVGGNIVDVLVKEGDQVTAGQLLFKIDPEPFHIQISQANAAIAEAQASVTALQNSPDLSGSAIGAAREDIAFAEARYRRVKALWDRGFSTKADYEAAQHAVAQAREELRLAEEKQQSARAQLATGAAVPGVNPRIASAKAQKASAELSLSRTSVFAPMAGQIAQADRLLLGQQVVAGVPMVTLVGVKGTYVEANFKETDLADMKPGQPATVSFDAYPGLELRGHVESIGAGTGSEFSVLPAQNATGNWVKVTQRVPVRIVLDEPSPRRLIAGLSTDVTVYTDESKAPK